MSTELFSWGSAHTTSGENRFQKSDSKCAIKKPFINSLTPRVKPWVIQSFLTFDSMDGTLVLFLFQFYPACNLEKLISFGIGTVRSEMIHILNCRLRIFTTVNYIYNVNFYCHRPVLPEIDECRFGNF